MFGNGYFNTGSGSGSVVVLKQSLTAADIQSLFTVPIDLIAFFPLSIGKYWRIIECDVNYTPGAIAFTNIIQVWTNSAAQNQYNYDLATSALSPNFGSFVDRRPVTNSTVYRVNKSLLITADADSATGDGTVDIYITAELVTL